MLKLSKYYKTSGFFPKLQNNDNYVDTDNLVSIQSELSFRNKANTEEVHYYFLSLL